MCVEATFATGLLTEAHTLHDPIVCAISLNQYNKDCKIMACHDLLVSFRFRSTSLRRACCKSNRSTMLFIPYHVGLYLGFLTIQLLWVLESVSSQD